MSTTLARRLRRVPEQRKYEWDDELQVVFWVYLFDTPEQIERERQRIVTEWRSRRRYNKKAGR